jgi:ADP-dependent NAD(P)H-hydrate dehydratase / NAD(P)H-hydrate epimerase
MIQFLLNFPDVSQFTAVGAGPGIGKKSNTCKALHELLIASDKPLVLDADALNILSENKDWLKELPANSILTPHPGEFKRLAGETAGSWERIQKQRDMARELNVIIVLKGAYTSVALPDGRLFFNSTGNPGMATAGSGDVLTGIYPWFACPAVFHLPMQPLPVYFFMGLQVIWLNGKNRPMH